jgi:response regulator RpfG family c-di-GMP phosphodiesterase
MEGHAQRAKELLEQVNRELKVAAEIANQRHK